MGRGYTKYRFPDSGAEDAWVLHSAFLNYRLQDGSLLHVRQRDCWCPKCDCFVVGEDFATVEELNVEVAQLLNPDTEQRLIIDYIGKPVEQLIEELRVRIKWRHTREAPAKCLKCGSTGIVPLPDCKEFKHPKTGQRVVFEERGWACTKEWHAEFTTEGDLIPSDKC
jgi:hypothetical protein